LKKYWKIITGIILLAIILIIAIIFFSLKSIIKSGIETGLPKITGTPVALYDFGFSPLAGKLTVNEFIIHNPEGYKTDHAFRLGRIVIEVDTDSLFSDKIIIRKILVDDIHVIHEQDLTDNNLNIIKKNIEQFANKEKESDSEQDETAEEKADKKGKTIQIDELIIKNGKITVAAKLLKGSEIEIELPNIHIEDIGRESDGTSVGDASEKIYITIYEAVVKAVNPSPVNLGVIKDTGVDIIKDVKGIFK